jgi:hypothetical protein
MDDGSLGLKLSFVSLSICPSGLRPMRSSEVNISFFRVELSQSHYKLTPA